MKVAAASVAELGSGAFASIWANAPEPYDCSYSDLNATKSA
jgi:hypothetical protein